jgi:hypothetical protein
MSVSMKDLDPAFRGAGQKEYPFFSGFPVSYVFIMPDNFISLTHFETIA